jgi:hypothetical protein
MGPLPVERSEVYHEVFILEIIGTRYGDRLERNHHLTTQLLFREVVNAL